MTETKPALTLAQMRAHKFPLWMAWIDMGCKTFARCSFFKLKRYSQQQAIINEALRAEPFVMDKVKLVAAVALCKLARTAPEVKVRPHPQLEPFLREQGKAFPTM